MRAEAFSLGLGLFWNRYTGLAYTAVGVIIKLVQRIHIPSLAPFAVKVAAIVLKRVKVLRHSLHQLFETRVRLWAGPIATDQLVKPSTNAITDRNTKLT